MKGRKRRLRNFDKRAEAFLRHLKSSVESPHFSRELRDMHFVAVGRGQFRRMIGSKDPVHQLRVRKAETALAKLVGRPYRLVPLAADSGGRVQELVNKPTFNQFVRFMHARIGKYAPIAMTLKEKLLCRKFMGEYPAVTLSIVATGYDALMRDLSSKRREIGEYDLRDDNVVLQGLDRSGALRISIIDL